jgi:integrase
MVPLLMRQKSHQGKMNAATLATTTQTWHSALDRLEGAFAPATLRNHRDSFAVFAAWCASRGTDPLPASAAQVAAFLAEHGATASVPTLKRRLSAIRRLHHLSGLPDPTDDEVVVIALRRAQRANPRRPAQALGLTRARRDRLMAACGSDMIGLRNRALLAVGYDTLCRQSELVALRVEELEPVAGDRLRVLVRRAKNNPFGLGRALGRLRRNPLCNSLNSIAGHSRWSRRIAAQIPFYEYDEGRCFRADDAPEDVAARRRDAFGRLPLKIANLSSVWVVLYTRPSRYNWMLQFYLRAEGLWLDWTGTGRLIFSLDCTDADFASGAERFTRAAAAMQADGWWWCAPGASNRTLRRTVLKELIAHRL